MLSPVLTEISVPPVVLPFAKTSDNSLLFPIAESTYEVVAIFVELSP
jgi:hypothetical protein